MSKDFHVQAVKMASFWINGTCGGVIFRAKSGKGESIMIDFIKQLINGIQIGSIYALVALAIPWCTAWCS